MNISMYQASVPRLANVLANLSGILDKAQAHLDARGIDVAALMGARIALDMYPFSKQVQIACDKSRSVVARLAGLDVPHYVDDERTLGELKVRIERTIAFIRSVPPERIDGTCGAKSLQASLVMPMADLCEAGSAGARSLESAARVAMSGRTAILVAHRLSQAATCDRVIVLEAGRVVEQGPHEELAAAEGPYSKLWQAWSNLRT